MLDDIGSVICDPGLTNVVSVFDRLQREKEKNKNIVGTRAEKRKKVKQTKNQVTGTLTVSMSWQRELTIFLLKGEPRKECRLMVS